jgi:hypothetical protein
MGSCPAVTGTWRGWNDEWPTSSPRSATSMIGRPSRPSSAGTTCAASATSRPPASSAGGGPQCQQQTTVATQFLAWLRERDITLDTCRQDVAIRFDTELVPLPAPLGAVLLALLDRRPNMATAANPRSAWLFPGGMPGDPIHEETSCNDSAASASRSVPAATRPWSSWSKQFPLSCSPTCSATRHPPCSDGLARAPPTGRPMPLPRPAERHRQSLHGERRPGVRWDRSQHLGRPGKRLSGYQAAVRLKPRLSVR